MGSRLVALAVWTSVAALAQPGQFAGVFSGVLFDPPTRSIRTVMGVPGGARLGPPVASGLDAGWLSPDQKSAVVMGKGVLTGLRQTDAGSFEDSQLLREGRAGRVSWSPDSKAAVFVSAAADGMAEIAVWRPTERTAVAVWPTAFPVDAIADLCVLPNGERVLMAVANAEGPAIYMLQAGQAAFAIPETENATVLAADPSGKFLYWFNGRSRTLLRKAIGDERGGAETLVASWPEEDNPASLRVSNLGKFVIWTTAGGSAVSLLADEAGGAVERLLLDTPAETLAPFGLDGWFLVAPRRRDPGSALVLHTSTSTLFFIPGSGTAEDNP